VGAERAQPNAGREVVLDESRRRLGEQHLATVRCRLHARGLVYVEPQIPLVAEDGPAGVQPHSHTHRRAGRPGVSREGALSGDRTGKGVLRLGEHDEEGVALGIHLVACVCGERLTQQTAMVGLYLGVAIAKPPQELGRTLDVGE
jgi:hypothetical protein